MTSVTFDESIGGDGSTVSDDNDPITGLGNGGHRQRFVPALANVVGIANFIKNSANGGSTRMWDSVVAVVTTSPSLTGLFEVNGYTLQEGDRVLVVGKNVKSLNGIYIAHSTAWTRANDANDSSDFNDGKIVADSNSGIVYVFNKPANFELGVSDIVFNTVSATDIGAQPLDATLTSLSALPSIQQNRMIYTTGVDTWSVTHVTDFGRALLASDDYNEMINEANLHSIFQPLDSTLTGLSNAIVESSNRLIYSTGVDTFSTTTITPFARSLLGDTDASEMRSTIGAVDAQYVADYVENNTGGVDLSGYAKLAGASFTGVVSGVTPTQEDDSTKFATTEWANDKFAPIGSVGGGGSFATMVYERGTAKVVRYSRNLSVSVEGDGYIDVVFDTPCSTQYYTVNVTTNNHFLDDNGNLLTPSLKVPKLRMSVNGFRVDFSTQFVNTLGDDLVFINVNV